MSRPPKNILYINVSRIGDTLLATPAIRAVAAHFPDAAVDVLAHPKRYEVLENLPFVRHVGGISKQRAFWKGRLGSKPYDLAFVCNYDKALVRYALRVARQVVAFRQDDEALNARLFKVVDGMPVREEHAVLNQLRLPASCGILPAGLALAYRVTESEAQWARKFLVETGLTDTHPLIGLQIASFPTKAYRDWPVENFEGLCRKILDVRPAARFLIFGGSLEKERTERLVKALGHAGILCAGKLSLRETASLMDRLDLYIGVDTGPTHLMGALHRPMVAMYHGNLPSWISKPLEHPSLHVIDHPRAGPECSADESMSEVSVESVWTSVKQALHIE